MMSTAITITTAQQLFQANLHERCELVRGELRMMSPSGAAHGAVVVNVTLHLGSFVKANDLGRVFGAETGFIIARDPDSVRAPDVAFVRQTRLEGGIPAQFFPGAPDIAVEVLSPSDSASKVHEKAEDWLRAGCQEVWLVDPQRKTVSKCTLSGSSVLHAPQETIISDLLPGFQLPVAELFK